MGIETTMSKIDPLRIIIRQSELSGVFFGSMYIASSGEYYSFKLIIIEIKIGI